jgi:Rod binding domain-containing protein
MPIQGVSAVQVGATAPDARPTAKNAKDAGVQFESLMMGQLLKTMREAGQGGWLGTGDDEAGATMMEIAEEHLGQALAAQGGLGIANLVTQGLERKS